MTNISKTVIFFGTEDFSLVSLKALVKAGYKIAGVVTKPDSKRGRGCAMTMPSIKKYAIENGITVWQPLKVSEINDKIKLLGEVTGVLVSFGRIIPESTINLFTPGIINVHPSLLPKYRGPSPIESAIENGDKQTGVSLIRLVAKMDAGPVYGRVIYKLSGHETRQELYKTLADTGADLLVKLLPSILDDQITPIAQDDSQASYCKLLDKNDNLLEANKITSEEAERLVRAHLGFPKTKYNIFNQTIIVTKAHIANEQNTQLYVPCIDNKFLAIDELIAPSGRTMSGRDYLNGNG